MGWGEDFGGMSLFVCYFVWVGCVVVIDVMGMDGLVGIESN